MSRHLLLSALAAVLLAPATVAHPKLVSANPAASGAPVAAPAAIAVEFSEPLMTRFSTLTLTTAAGQAVPVRAAADGKRLRATPARPLAPGRYRVQWRAAGADGHPVKGGYDFRVR